MTWPADPILDTAALRTLYGCFPSGVVAVCAQGPDGPVGLAASSFTSVSMDPPLVSFCIQNTSSTWPKLADLPRLGVSVLGSAHSVACRQLASKTGDRFAGLDLATTADGAVFVEGSPAQLDCSVEDLLPAGDHQIVLLRVHAARALPADEPLVFHASTFRELVRVA
ncbi:MULTISPECIES: flavin reductase family protein [Pseudonocardia]|uniref:NADH-FMN oxidoreductase RutF, flavin reductase (DIM6/NTAB) family n=1 Tax=Pseudonocardia oroxyli TaxID=366584 RepID=A0A1G8APH2_PSEOR|nr:MULTISPECIES: flavin reductase family protein [Pseudonocardia]MCF7548047.1 flavin reductase family protein [Pseudonocardia sp. WMMC193]SDH22932.1 NADH-FMN oxidoreductase RutF, flavin reductase (DIM6/NTAB) family [Pseudonocardia oroxyli]